MYFIDIIFFLKNVDFLIGFASRIYVIHKQMKIFSRLTFEQYKLINIIIILSLT